MRHVRIWLALASLTSVFALGDFASAELQPYEARVTVPRAQVRSGPGENFYPTGAIAAGETVEVYREAEGGWLAIRPPRESFSWVFGRHVKPGENGLAEIDRPEVDSRIGSSFGDQRNAVQVRLQKGEVVEILGEESAGNETWYKIAPPAGEFRWIHATHVERLGPIAAPTAESRDDSTVVTASATDGAKSSESTDVTPPPLAPGPPAAVQVEPRSSNDNWRSTAADRVPPTNNQQPAGSPPNAGTTPGVVASGSTAVGDLARQLTDIELRLSRMVASPPEQWNTDALERDTETLLAAAQTPADREAVKATLAKLDRFADLARRAQGQNPVVGVAPNPSMPLTASLPGTPTGDARITPFTDSREPTANGSPYDAVGILRPVVSKRPGAPQFALVDDRGQVVSFVTPTPDMNLQPYVGRRIAVNGTRGFIAEFQRAHVTAGRVTPLAERIVR